MISCVYQVIMSLLWMYYTVECNPEPLILTPLVKAGKIAEAQKAARVVPDMNGEKSFSGYLTVNEDCGNHLFFWFFPARNNWEKAPVLLWLQGGPGASSLLGMFQEIGPFNYVKKKKFVQNEYTWTADNNVIFLDQPVGTGFSFTEKGCYCENMTAMAADGYSFLIQFFDLFPNLLKNQFLLTGESFAGHFVPALAYEIHKNNPSATRKINLLGFVIGNAEIDTTCDKFATLLYENGVIDDKDKKNMTNIEDNISKAIANKDFAKAKEEDDKRFEIIFKSQLPSVYNLMYDRDSDQFFKVLVRRFDVRKQIHVSHVPYAVEADPPWVHMHDAPFYTDSVFYIEELLKTKQYLIGFYSGLLDTRIPFSSTECVLRELKWDGAEEYLAANRSAWYVGDRLAGWFKVAGNLFLVAVRLAGHMVPTDQPQAALDLVTAVLKSEPGKSPLSTLISDI